MKYMKKNLNYLESDTMMEERASEEHEDHDMTKQKIPIDPPREVNTHKRIPPWAREIIQDT